MKHIYVIGDSISIQYGPYLKQALEGIMTYARKEGEAEAHLNLDNPQGANGGDSSMVLGFLQGLKQSRGLEADILLLNCGLHDIKTNPHTGQKQVPLTHYKQNLQSIIQLVSSWKPRLVWIRTTPCDEAIHNTRPAMQFHRYANDCDAYNGAADRIMTEATIPIIDLHTFTKNLGPDLYCDHVHFHDHIRQQQAAFIAGWLQGHIHERTITS
ncbi:MAG: SGNH/GDSL hydrolase family protein [Chloroflexota bacterium]